LSKVLESLLSGLRARVEVREMAFVHVTYLRSAGFGKKARKVSYTVPETEVLEKAARIAAAGNAARIYIGGTTFGADRLSWTWKAAS